MTAENKVIRVELEWEYSPKNILEKEIRQDVQGIELLIDNGVAKAKISPKKLGNDKSLPQKLTAIIQSRLQAAQLLKHEDFTLKGYSRVDIKSNGKKIKFINASIRMTAKTEAILVKGETNGNIIRNTKQDKINKISRLSRLIHKHRNIDNTLDQMLTSYQNAVKDPQNELVHLYEIKDALKSIFGSNKKARKELKITEKGWSKLGDITNNPNRKEGRHRGLSKGELQKSSISDLKTARKCAVNLIEKYLEYLESVS